MEKISIRNAKFAKIGLQDMLDYIGHIGVMAELGCYVGDSTEIFAKNVDTIYAIDPWVNGYDPDDDSSDKYPMEIVEAQFDELCKSHLNIRKIKMRSEEAIKLFNDNYLYLVYVDAIHTEQGVRADIELWLPKIKEGGWIAGHDYGNRHHKGVKPALDGFFIPDKTFRDTSWCKRL